MGSLPSTQEDPKNSLPIVEWEGLLALGAWRRPLREHCTIAMHGATSGATTSTMSFGAVLYTTFKLKKPLSRDHAASPAEHGDRPFPLCWCKVEIDKSPILKRAHHPVNYNRSIDKQATADNFLQPLGEGIIPVVLLKTDTETETDSKKRQRSR